MSLVRAASSAVIPAPPESVYAILADYREEHPRILPRQYFSAYAVESGGQGAGTIFTTTLQVMGTTRQFRMQVSEPQPGRQLAETDLDSGLTTRFDISPDGDGQTRLEISSEWQSQPGFTGLLDRLVTPRIMQRIYNQQLDNLKAYVKRGEIKL